MIAKNAARGKPVGLLFVFDFLAILIGLVSELGAVVFRNLRLKRGR
jgi:hypothetical protein